MSSIWWIICNTNIPTTCLSYLIQEMSTYCLLLKVCTADTHIECSVCDEYRYVFFAKFIKTVTNASSFCVTAKQINVSVFATVLVLYLSQHLFLFCSIFGKPNYVIIQFIRWSYCYVYTTGCHQWRLWWWHQWLYLMYCRCYCITALYLHLQWNQTFYCMCMRKYSIYSILYIV